ncbi:MAG: hypothetical protein EAZ91_10795 [Cytophagales bacterium]|nr:MAG: hypothetical protein EAZ91_10795 [Cytophagales bacterium]
MKKFLTWVGLVIVMALFIGIALLTIGVNIPLPIYTQHEQPTPRLIIQNCTLIDVIKGVARPNRTLVIDNGRITRIDSGATGPWPGYTVIDGAGKYAMPALWDMHLHTLSLSPQLHFPLLIANGITNVRDMGDGDSWISEFNDDFRKDKGTWEQRVSKENLLMPTIWESCSYHVEAIDGADSVNYRQKVRELVTRLKARHEPFVKLQLEDSELPAPIFYEIQHQARQQQMKVLGHLSYNVSIDSVLANGYPTIEHAWALLPHFVRNKKRFEKDLDTKHYELANQDSVLTLAVLRNIAKYNTYYVPTHVASNRKEALVFDVNFRQNPLNRYVEGTQLGLWKLWAWLHTSGYDKPAQQQILMDYYRRGLTVTRLAHQNGVQILAGTDALDRYVYHGFSLHDELGELAKAGLTNADILRTATLNPARYYNQTTSNGSLEPGNVANFILLRANPLANIANTQTIEAVYTNQRLYNGADLAQMKAFVQEQAQSFAVRCRFIWNMLKGIV